MVKVYCITPNLAMDLIDEDDERGYNICEAAERKGRHVKLVETRGRFPLVLGVCKKKHKGGKR